MKKTILILLLLVSPLFAQKNQWSFGRYADVRFGSLLLGKYGGMDSLMGKTGTTTYWNKTGWHSGLGASYMGNLTTGTLSSTRVQAGSTTNAGANINILRNGQSNYSWTPNGRTSTIIDGGNSSGTTMSVVSKSGAGIFSGFYLGDSASETDGQMVYYPTGDSMRFVVQGGIYTLTLSPSGVSAHVYNTGSVTNGTLPFYGNGYYIGSTQIVDASRNLTNIGTIGSGAITSTGTSLFNTLTTTNKIDTAYTNAVSGIDAGTNISITNNGGNRWKVTNTASTSGFTTIKRTADTTNSVATPVNVGSLVIPVTNGVYTYYKFVLIYQTGLTTTGNKLSLTFPAVTVQSAAVIIHGQTTDGATTEPWCGTINSSGDVVTSTGVAAANVNYVATIEGIILPSASGYLQLQWSPEVAAAATLKAGSMVMYTSY